MKKILSVEKDTTFHIESLEFMVESFSREELEAICEHIFQRILEPIERILESQNLTKDDIHKVFVVGGASWMPKVREILSSNFKKE